MMKIPVENLGLFEQLDRIVVAFFSKQQPSSPYDLNVSITQEHLDQKKQELEPLGYQAVQLPLGMALDNIIQQPHYKNLILGGFNPWWTCSRRNYSQQRRINAFERYCG